MTIARRAARLAAICTFLTALTVASVCATGRAWAQPHGGGVSAVVPESDLPPVAAPPRGPLATTGPPGAATIVRGRAIAPAGAPPTVKAVIAAANRIRTKPYVWGGGHGRWWDGGYDCSGAVSYALHGAGLIDSPMPSGPMASWGSPGAGRWITVYANAGHAYAVIAGLRWDTAGNTSGTGPRWHAEMASSAGFVARHPPGY